jgi:hypothetical protein
MENFVKSKQIKCICKIINSEMDTWNAINKHWLKKYDNTFGVVFFFFVFISPSCMPDQYVSLNDACTDTFY